MNNIKRIVALTFCLALSVTQIFALIKSPPEKAILPNGMRVIVVEDKSLPLAAVGLMFSSQTLQEDNCNSGLGRIYRSLLKNAGFADKTRFDFNADLERVGVLADFGGSSESFYAACQGNAEQLDTMLEAVNSLGFALHPTLEDFSKAKAEALRFLKTSERFPLSTGRMAKEIWQDLYPDAASDCHGPIVENKLNRLDFSKLDDFARRIFVPNNAVLVVVGDVDATEVFKKSMSFFGSHKAKKLEEPTIVASKTTESRKQEHIQFLDVDETQVLIGFEAPGYADPQMPAARLWKTAFDGINSSWLETVVKRDFPELKKLYASYLPGKDRGLFLIGFSKADADINRPVNFILSSLANMCDSPAKGDELQRIIEMQQLKDLDKRETRIERAYELGLSELMSSYLIADGLVAAYSRVTPADLKTVAQKMFAGNRYVIRIAHPLKMQKTEEIPVQVKELKNKAHIMVRNFAGSEVVGITMLLGIDTCSTVEKDKKLARMLAEMISGYVNDKENHRLNRSLDNVGASLSASYNASYFALTAKVQKQNLQELINLLRDLLKFPDYSDRFFSKAKEKMIRRIKEEQGSTTHILNAKTMEALYPGMNIFSAKLSAEETQKISFKELQNFYRSWATGSNLYVAAVGNFDSEKVLKSLSEALKDIPQGNTSVSSQCPPWVGQPLDKIKVERVKLPAANENAFISVAFRLKPFLVMEEKDELRSNFGANLVMSHVLFSSRNSILAQELKKNDAFRGLIGNYMTNSTNAIQMFIAEVPENKVEEAKKVIERIIADIPEMDFSKENIVAAGQNLRSYFNRMLEKSDAQSQVLGSFLYNGLKEDFLHEILSVYSQVSIQDVKKAAKNNFNTYFMLIGEPNR